MNGIKTKLSIRNIQNYLLENPPKIIKFFLMLIFSNIFFFLLFSKGGPTKVQSPMDLNPNLIPVQIPIKVFAQSQNKVPVHISLVTHKNKILCHNAFLNADWKQKSATDAFDLGPEKNDKKILPVYIENICFQKLISAIESGLSISAYPFITNPSEFNTTKHQRENNYEIIF